MEQLFIVVLADWLRQQAWSKWTVREALDAVKNHAKTIAPGHDSEYYSSISLAALAKVGAEYVCKCE